MQAADPGGAAEFPVAEHLHSRLALQVQRVQDRRVLRRAQGGQVDVSAVIGVARVDQRLRPQQAADVISADAGVHVPPVRAPLVAVGFPVGA